MSSDTTKKPEDVRFKPAGIGLSMTWLCMGCNKPRSMIGRRGVGHRQRCAICVAAKKS